MAFRHSNIKIQKKKKERKHNRETFLVNPPYHLCMKIRALKEHWEKTHVFRMVYLCDKIVKRLKLILKILGPHDKVRLLYCNDKSQLVQSEFFHAQNFVFVFFVFIIK